jgi:hypothetical protein
LQRRCPRHRTTSRLIRFGRPRSERGHTPLIGPRWTGGPGPPRRSTGLASVLASCLRQPANSDPPRGATAAQPPAAQTTLQISPPFMEITNIPFHLYKSLSTRSFLLCLGPCSPYFSCSAAHP